MLKPEVHSQLASPKYWQSGQQKRLVDNRFAPEKIQSECRNKSSNIIGELKSDVVLLIRLIAGKKPDRLMYAKPYPIFAQEVVLLQGKG